MLGNKMSNVGMQDFEVAYNFCSHPLKFHLQFTLLTKVDVFNMMAPLSKIKVRKETLL